MADTTPDARPVCDGCGIGLRWTGTDWEHVEGTRCSHFDQPSSERSSRG